VDIPPGLFQGGGNILGADVAFGKGLFMHISLIQTDLRS
jgi:hypothetical protein